jgi:hypothetical protein
MKNHITYPGMPKGYQLDACGDWFSIIVPESTTNLFINPSYEFDFGGTSPISSGTLALSDDWQYAGSFSMKVTPGANISGGCAISIGSTVIGTPYTISFYFYGTTGLKYKARILDTLSGAEISAVYFTAMGHSQRVIASVVAIGAFGLDVIIQRDAHTNTAPYYIDAVQFEAKSYATTYCDGDQRGFVPTRNDYFWNGLPHLSTSTRIAQSRAGGRESPLSHYGFTTSAIMGLGMAPTNDVFLPMGFQGGASYQRTVYEQRKFSLIGDMRGDQIDFTRRQSQLMQDLRSDIVTPPQPLMLKYQRVSAPKTPISEECYIPCIFEPGPGNSFDNLYGESTELRFIQDRIPTIAGSRQIGTALDTYDEWATTAYIAQRSPGGVWSFFGTGANGPINAVAYAPSGDLYIAGEFTTFNGFACSNIVRISIYGTYSDVGGGVDDAVYGMVIDMNSILYVTGLFQNAGGGAVSAPYVAYCELVTDSWAGFGAGFGFDAPGRVIVLDIDNSPIIGGDFTTADGVAVNYIVKYNVDSALYSSYATGLSSSVLDIAISPASGYVYAVGRFLTTDGGGTTLNGVGYWNGSAWVAMGSGITDSIAGTSEGYGVCIAKNGDVYITGMFDGPANGIARWNGSQWSALGNGIGTNPTYGSVIKEDINGTFWISGSFGITRWNLSTYIPVDILLPNNASLVSVITIANDGTVLIAGGSIGIGGWVGTSNYSGLTTVYNPGDANAYPVIVFTGRGILRTIRNVTTGKEITFDNLTLPIGEHAYLVLDPANVRFYSNFRTNLSTFISRGSQETEFYLQGSSATNPTGENIIALFFLDMINSRASIYFNPRYQSLQSLLYK